MLAPCSRDESEKFKSNKANIRYYYVLRERGKLWLRLCVCVCLYAYVREPYRASIFCEQLAFGIHNTLPVYIHLSLSLSLSVYLCLVSIYLFQSRVLALHFTSRCVSSTPPLWRIKFLFSQIQQFWQIKYLQPLCHKMRAGIHKPDIILLLLDL